MLILFCVLFVLVVLFGMFEVLRWTSEHFAQSPTGPAKLIELLKCQDLFRVARFLGGFSLDRISNRESLFLRPSRFYLCFEILLKGFLAGRLDKRHK